MKRKTIEEICKRTGVPLAPDDDPRYSEPWSISFLSRTSRPSAPSATTLPPAAARLDSGSDMTNEPVGTACATAAKAVSEWEEIVIAGDDMVSAELLGWAGLLDVWSRCLERWERFDLEWDHDFLSEVAESCTHIFIDEEEWDHEMPGRSGVSYIIQSDDPELLRQELRDELACQLRSWRRELWA